MPISEILIVVESECQENPFLEINETNLLSDFKKIDSKLVDPFTDYEKKSLDWIPAYETSFANFLEEQSKVLFTGKRLIIAVEIIKNISPLGFLEISPQEVAINTKVSLKEVENVRKELMSLDGLGIASLNYREYLINILKTEGKENISEEYIDSFLTAATKTIPNIDLVFKDLYQKIKQISPYPSYSFIDNYEKRGLVDACVDFLDDKSEIELYNLPEISFLNKEYLKLARIADDEAKRFINDKFQRARILLRAIHKRNETLKEVIKFISSYQREFLTNYSAFPRSLTEEQVGKGISMHQSTISRAIKSKIIKTPRGFISLKSLLQNKISKEQITVEIKNLLFHHPQMSDQEISNYLNLNLNIKIARRTISKYRNIGGIKSKSQRNL